MICDICKKRPATLYFTQVINNKKTELNLCNECAGKHDHTVFDFTQEIDFPNFLVGLFDPNINVHRPIDEKKSLKCPNCNLDYYQFMSSGLMGCNKCYDTFSEDTDLLLRKIHGSNLHGGKLPKRTGEDIKIKKQISSLRAQLQEAVAREDFERAAEIRDSIKEIENK